MNMSSKSGDGGAPTLPAEFSVRARGENQYDVGVHAPTQLGPFEVAVSVNVNPDASGEDIGLYLSGPHLTPLLVAVALDSTGNAIGASAIPANQERASEALLRTQKLRARSAALEKMVQEQARKVLALEAEMASDAKEFRTLERELAARQAKIQTLENELNHERQLRERADRERGELRELVGVLQQRLNGVTLEQTVVRPMPKGTMAERLRAAELGDASRDETQSYKIGSFEELPDEPSLPSVQEWGNEVTSPGQHRLARALASERLRVPSDEPSATDSGSDSQDNDKPFSSLLSSTRKAERDQPSESESDSDSDSGELKLPDDIE